MSQAFSAKETAHKIEVQAQSATTYGYDASSGCSVTESNMVNELRALRTNPDQLKAVRSQMHWDNWKPNGLPSVQIVDLPGNQIELKIYDTNNTMNVDSTGRMYNTTAGDPSQGTIAWTINNFKRLDKDHNGWLTDYEMNDTGVARFIPNYGSEMGADQTIGLSYGFSALNGFGNHLSQQEVKRYEISRRQLQSLQLRYSDKHCK